MAEPDAQSVFALIVYLLFALVLTYGSATSTSANSVFCIGGSAALVVNFDPGPFFVPLAHSESLAVLIAVLKALFL